MLGIVLVALVASILYGIMQAVPPYLLKLAVDRYLDPAGHQAIPRFLANFLSPRPLVGIVQIAVLLYLPSALLSFVLEFGQDFAMQVVGQRVM